MEGIKFKTKKRFTFLEHTADQYIRAFGETLEEAFSNGGLAVMDTLTELSKIEAKIPHYFEIEEEGLEELLYSFIEELLVKWELTNTLFSIVDVTITQRDGKYHLHAYLKGEEFNPKKHPQRVGVKAMTYCLMKIVNTPPKVVVEFVVDI